MFTLTDIFVALLLLYYFINGWITGLWRSLLGPFCFILGILLSLWIYQKTHHFLLSLSLTVLLPFIIYLIGLEWIRARKRPQKDKKEETKNKKIPPFSSFLGGLVNLSWSGSWLALTLILLVWIPASWKSFKKIQEDILESKSYSLLKWGMKDSIPIDIQDIKNFTGMLKDPEKIKIIQSTEEYQALMQEQSVKNILEDEETVKQLQNGSLPKLLLNPRIQALLQDEETLKKFLALDKKILE